MQEQTFQELYDFSFGKELTTPEDDFVANPIFQQIYNNCHTNQMNQIIVVTGLPRTGKSELCIYSAWALDRDARGNHLFDPETQIVKTMEELTEFIDSNNRTGANVVWEEAGISEKGANAREWQKKENILLNDIFQIMGMKKHIVWINLPRTFFLDKGARSLSHWNVETLRVNFKTLECYARFRQVGWNTKKNEPMNIRPKFFRDGRYTISQVVRVPQAPHLIRKAYYDMQKQYKRQWITEVKNKIKALKASPQRRNFTIEKGLVTLKDNKKMFWDAVKKKPNIDYIGFKLDIPNYKARILANVWSKEESLKEGQ